MHNHLIIIPFYTDPLNRFAIAIPYYFIPQVKLITALSIAQLALKHRQNKNQRQRIVLFLHSPIPTADADALLRLGKKLKKNNVSVDVVSWGQQVEENSELLSKFIEAVDGSNENSHLLAAPPGPSLLSDLLISSPIIQEEGGAVPPGITSSAGFEFGVDPNLDPELALVCICFSSHACVSRLCVFQWKRSKPGSRPLPAQMPQLPPRPLLPVLRMTSLLRYDCLHGLADFSRHWQCL